MTVMYYHKSQLKSKAPVPKSRQMIWLDKGGESTTSIGLYQPEDDGYLVGSICLGIYSSD